MHQLRTRFLTLTIVLQLTGLATYAQATMPGAPWGAYADYFKYYRPGAADMPAGADLTSNAIIGIYISDIQGETSDDEDDIAAGTGFLIYTRRNDHKICLCTAGHNIDELSGAVGEIFVFDAYMKYQGKPSTQNPSLNQPVSGFKSTLHPLVVAMINDDPTDGEADAALLLVDEAELPVAAPYMLGYSEENVYSPQSSFYTISHPNKMPQRIADDLAFTDATPVYIPLLPQFLLSTSGSNTTGPGSSGAPIIFKGQGSFVTGIYNGSVNVGIDDTYIPATERVGGDPPIEYIRGYSANTKIAALMPAIRKHCWKQDSATIATSQSYKQGISLDNSAQVAKFTINRSITSQAEIAATADQSYRAANPGTTLVKANRLTINCSVTPGTGLPRLLGLAKEVRLEAGFSYTASGNYFLEMNTVVPEQVASTARTVGAGNSPPDTAANFRVYPNPSSGGVFHLSFPQNNDDYSLKIYRADGRLVYQAETMAGQNPYRFSLEGKTHGIYVVSLYKKRTGEQLFSKTIIYSH